MRMDKCSIIETLLEANLKVLSTLNDDETDEVSEWSSWA
jgi:hypothetical protein